jgi:hypothetical protein
MGCLGVYDMVRDTTVEEMSQAVFSASPLGGYISRLTKLSSVSAVSTVERSSKQLEFKAAEI